MRTIDILVAIGKIPPQAWDAIVPHGPLTKYGAGILEKVALNPQPLPPKAAVSVAAVELAQRVSQMAIEANVRGENPAGWVSELLDDWCGTGWPKKWPWPPGGPDPDPDPVYFKDGQLMGAVVLADVASRLRDGELRGVFEKGAERLAEVALGGKVTRRAATAK